MNKPTKLKSEPKERKLFLPALGKLGITLSIGSLLSLPAAAEDVEIYTSTDALGVNPNVLFVIDTSGSMDEPVEVAQYDGSTDYTGDCDPDQLYVGGIDGQSGEPNCDTDYYFPKSQLRCETAVYNFGPDGNGYKSDRFAQWNDDYNEWYSLNSYMDDNRPQSTHYECQDDEGDHGFESDDGEPYVANGNNGPWDSNNSRDCYWNGYRWRCYGGIWNNHPGRTVYSGNYLNWFHNYGGELNGSTRMEVVVDAAKDMIDATSDINVGLMRFDTRLRQSPDGYYRNNIGGPVSHGMLDISDPANKQTLKDILDTFDAEGSTPLTETVWEGMQYFRGQSVTFGRYSDPVSHSSSRDGNTYISPMEFDCQDNYMVVFSDGAPTDDRDADAAINNLISGTPDGMGSCGHGNQYENPSDSCLDELAYYMYREDHAGSLAGEQNITSYYVSGFNGADDTLMQSAAVRGGTETYLSASNPSEFASVFNAIITEIQEVNASFTSPAVSVNALNRLKNNNELYFALFEPANSPHWNGNIKKYILAADESGAVDSDGEPVLEIQGVDGQSAVNDNTGLFENDVKSFWQLSGDDRPADGDETALGGAAHRLHDYNAATDTFDGDSRDPNVYTYFTDYTPDATGFDGSGIDLVDINHIDAELSGFTGDIDDTVGDLGLTLGELLDTLGLPDTLSINQLVDRIRWIGGDDVNDIDQDNNTTEGRPGMGGILHTEPVLVNYSSDDKGTTNEDDDEQVNLIITTTNDGYVHLFKTTDGGTDERLEHSAIIPGRTLGQMEQLYQNSGADVAYRLDGNVEVWRHDGNEDNQITTGGDDFVYAYFGQRRGGNAIFAFDITDPDTPKLLWQIDPETVDDAETNPVLSPFNRMGETWSRPRRHTIQAPNSSDNELEPRDILVFGGGYDSNQNDVADSARAADQAGNAIYMVDAKTGELIWWASNNADDGTPNLTLPEMDHSFASNLRILDTNGDGIADSIFATDIGGQVWRFDINDTLNVGDGLDLNDRITGGVIADLQLERGADPDTNITAENNRRLYYAPDVAIIQESPADTPQLSISIGSGYRAHPLNKTVADKFFVLKYDNVKNPPADYSAVKLYVDDLLNITSLNFADPDLEVSADDRDMIEDNGWQLDLGTGQGEGGEKSLSESITVDGKVVFTTYTPPGDGANDPDQQCGGSQGASKTYVVSVFDASPVANLDGIGGDSSSAYTLDDRSQDNDVPGIAPEGKVVFPDIEGVETGRLIVGRELLPVKIKNNPKLTYWVQE